KAQNRRWLPAAAAALLAVGGGWLGWTQWTANELAKDPAHLLARSYTEQRPFELRIPGAAQASFGAQQRGAGSAFQRSQPLMEAELLIKADLAKDSNNRKFLVLRARAEMLGWEPEPAIATLNRALELQPDDAELLADLGMAYALQGDATSRTID